MKNILFVNPGPFGSLTDTYYYYMLLKDKYDITYFGFDEGKKAPKYDGIKIIHLAGSGNDIIQKFLFLTKTVKLIRDNRYNFIFINYFIGSSIIRLLSRGNLVIDIRTSYITPNKYKRLLCNVFLIIEVRFYKNISAISESLVKYLHLPKKTHILPLGAPSFPLIEKDFKTLRILYVGTFHNRNIANTIYAFAKFLSEKNDKSLARYTIIGNGSDFEIKKILNAIAITGMEEYITYKGPIRYPELIDYLKSNNVGMSYIPITTYYDNQPPTKTFEYLLSGMAVIATGTIENKKIITPKNGIIIGDTVDNIVEGLNFIVINRFKFNSEIIQKDSQLYSWYNIINDNLIPFIENI